MIRTCYYRHAVIWARISGVKQMSVEFSPSVEQEEFSELHLMSRSMSVMLGLYFVFFWGFVPFRLKLSPLPLSMRSRLVAVQMLTCCRHFPNLAQPQRVIRMKGHCPSRLAGVRYKAGRHGFL